MKKKITVSILLAFVLSLSLATLAGCGGGDGDGKQVPVYQGMSITSASAYSASAVLNGGAYLSNNGTADNDNHNGYYEGDHADRNDVIDKDNPYPDNDSNENIEEEIKSSLDVVGSPDTIYYATPGEDIYINIHIDNPDSFEIMSFTLNGKKYSSYMFEEGSDMETIVLKYNVGNAAGIVEYTIDAIKYIDGTEIKDVIIDGNKTVMAGIKTQNQVAASVSGVDIDTNALSFNVNIKDNNSLIAFSMGTLKAIIYDGFEIVAEKDLALGENSVSFDALKTNTLYQYAVVGYYDDLSGDGFKMNVLYKDAFYTDSVVLFDNITVEQENVSFSFLWHEDHVGKTISVLKLYQGDRLVETLSANATSVANLLSNNTYKLVAEYHNENNTESIYIEFTTLAKQAPEISVASPTKTQSSVGFEINETDIDNVGSITKIELVHANGTVVADSLDQRTFANLLSNNAYTVKVTYAYDLNDGEGEHTVTKELAITTLAKATPEISVVSPTKTQSSVGFEINETDIDNVGSITKIELVHASGAIVADSLDQRTFANLLSNNAYTVKVTYVYDLNDGEGEHTVTKELTITTDAKTAPIFSVKNENITTESINAEYDISDVDDILSYYKVELYNGDTLISENTEKEIVFEELKYYTDYKVRFTYKYNLNDGNGEKTVTYDHTFKTLPYIDVTECSIANTSAVSEGDTIFMSVKLDNPLGMTVESVVINGETYNVTGASTKNKIFVEIVYNGQFAGGDTYLKVDKVNTKIDSTALTVEPKSELSDNVFINGIVKILSIEYVNEEFGLFYGGWIFPSEKVYVLITLDNPTGYNIDSIVVMYDQAYSSDPITALIKLDNNRYYYETSWTKWSPELSISSISYHNEYISKSISVPTIYSVSSLVYKVASDEIVYISTAEDLKNMNGGYYYELKNDIDLSGLEWRGGNFDGVFDGKGYSIKNMSFVGTIKNEDAYLGLFSEGQGVIQNVNIEEATIVATVTSDDGHWYASLGGTLIAYATSHLNIYGCTVDEYTVIDIAEGIGGGFVGSVDYKTKIISIANCINSGNVSAGVAGGFCGRVAEYDTIIITSCTNNGNISANLSGDTFAGGFVGIFEIGIVTITNCTNSGNISANSSSEWAHACAGGLLGSTNYYNFHINITSCVNSGNISANSPRWAYAGGLVCDASGPTITNCTNSGSVSARSILDPSYAGGLVARGSYATITNCTNSGSVSARSIHDTSYAGGLVGFQFSVVGDDGVNFTITNSYSLSSGNGYNGEPCTVEQLNSKEFYTETLGWSEEIWDFSDLDVENGKISKLKTNI